MPVVDATLAFENAPNAGALPDHVSFSQLDLMIKCPEAYRQKRILGARGAATSPLVVGSGVHAGIAAMYEQLRANPRTSKKTLVETAITTATSDIETRSEHLDYALETEQVAELIEVYAAERPAHIKPVAIESPFSVDLPGIGIPLVGRIDVESESSLVEIKTSSRKVTVPTGAWKLQAWLYQAAVPKPVEWHVLVKQKTPLLITSAALLVPYDAKKTRMALELASATLERIHKLYDERGAYEPWPMEGITHPWACSMCDVRDECVLGGVA